MKFVHISDLHLGKRLREISLIEDQAFILDEILNIIEKEKPEAVIIAGDVYDKSVPSADAVRLFDDFISGLADGSRNIFIISGNHDSAERLAFGSRLFDKSGVHISPVYDGNVTPVTLEDEYGPVDIFMLPFVKPVNVKACFPEEEISSYTDAVGCAISHMPIDKSRRNVLVTHQFVTGSARSDSETISVGGTDNVDAKVFRDFDYVALGHLHRPQQCGRENIRYCGTPLKYSFSEADDEKSVTIVSLFGKGEAAACPKAQLPQSSDGLTLHAGAVTRRTTGGLSIVRKQSLRPLRGHLPLHKGGLGSCNFVCTKRFKGYVSHLVSAVDIKTAALVPLHDMVNIRGSYDEITSRSFYEKTTWQSDFVRITLTDEEEIPGVGDKLRTIYKNWLQIVYDNKRTRNNNEIISIDSEVQESPFDLFARFYELQNNSPLSEEQADYMLKIISRESLS